MGEQPITEHAISWNDRFNRWSKYHWCYGAFTLCGKPVPPADKAIDREYAISYHKQVVTCVKCQNCLEAAQHIIK